MDAGQLPSFMTPTADAPAMPMAGVMAEGAGVAQSGQKTVTVGMTGQEQLNWCWSSVTQAVLGWADQQVAQSDVATAHITHNGRQASCAPPNGSNSNGLQCATGNGCQASCNDPHILSVVLTENGRFAGFISNGAAPSFDALVQQLNAEKPVPCRVQWSVGGGHFVVVSGWTVDAGGNQSVHVLDPASASADVPVSERILPYLQFVNDYTDSGVTGSVNYSYQVQ
jgi:hypothetical protein